MSLDVLQFRQYVVRPALQSIGLWSDAAEELVTGTAMVETTLNYVKQLNGGIAVGVCQMEPATYKDIKLRLFKEHKDLYDRIKNYLYFDTFPLQADYLMGNMTASVIFCRLKYYLFPDALPEAHDYSAMAAYHKKIYNTSHGATDITRSVNIFKSVVLGYHYHG